MPYSRLQYNGDNQYTTKDKRNLLLTQEVIEKINNMPVGGQPGIVTIEWNEESLKWELVNGELADGAVCIFADSTYEAGILPGTIYNTDGEEIANLDQMPRGAYSISGGQATGMLKYDEGGESEWIFFPWFGAEMK